MKKATIEMIPKLQDSVQTQSHIETAAHLSRQKYVQMTLPRLRVLGVTEKVINQPKCIESICGLAHYLITYASMTISNGVDK